MDLTFRFTRQHLLRAEVNDCPDQTLTPGEIAIAPYTQWRSMLSFVALRFPSMDSHARTEARSRAHHMVRTTTQVSRHFAFFIDFVYGVLGSWLMQMWPGRPSRHESAIPKR